MTQSILVLTTTVNMTWKAPMYGFQNVAFWYGTMHGCSCASFSYSTSPPLCALDMCDIERVAQYSCAQIWLCFFYIRSVIWYKF